MKIALVHNAVFPVANYGGTERLVWWMAKGLSGLGHSVVLVAAKGSRCPFAEVRVGDFTSNFRSAIAGVEIEHHFAKPPHPPEAPYLVTIGGNGKAGERFPLNTVFVSRNHAERHGSSSFVWNGIDPDDYLFDDKRDRYLTFLAKASWRVKNVNGAIAVARRSGREIRIVGGGISWLPKFRQVRWMGMLGGEAKARVLAKTSGLIFPVLWHEPFGLAVAESLISGSPVIASPFGSLPELVNRDVGRICQSLTEMVEAVSELSTFHPSRCREYALEHFHYLKMVKAYLTLYERILAGESLSSSEPVAKTDQGGLLCLSDGTARDSASGD